MKTLSRALIGGEELPFGQRIFDFAILLAVAMTLFGALMDALQGADVVIELAFAGFWGLSYYLVRLRGLFRVFSPISFGVLVFAFLPYIWILSGGIRSVIPLYAVVFLSTICVVLSGRMRAVMAGCLLGVTLLLVLRDAYLRTPVSPLDGYDSIIGAAVHLCVVLASMFLLLGAYSRLYAREKARSEAYARTIEQNYRQQLYYMETLEGLIGRLRSERHDWNSHLCVIYGLLEDGGGAQALSYTADLLKTAGDYRGIVSIPYPMLRALLNYKLSLMDEHGFALRLAIDLPENLSLNEADLAVILGNLLDNAFDACLPLPEAERYLALTLQYKPDYIVVQAENPIPPAAAPGGKGHTTKQDREEHGFGLANIEYLVRKHSGLMKIEPADSVFRVSLALLTERKE